MLDRDYPVPTLRQLLDSPIVRRHFRLTRPGHWIRRHADIAGIYLLLGLFVGYAASFANARFYLDELAYILGFPFFIAFGNALFLAFRRHFESTIPLELQLSALTPPEIAASFYLARVISATICLLPPLLVLPFFKDAFVSVSYTAHLLFVVLFLFTMDGVAKLSFFLALSFTGLTAFFQILGASFAGILALYGLGAVLRGVPDHWLLSPVLLVGAALAIRFFSIQTWRPFTRAAGRAYLRRVLILLEGDEEVVDRPAPPSYGV